MKFKILFTGAGRRVELLQAFRQASLNLNIGLEIYGADITDTAPALAFCDHTRKICGMKEKEYISQLLDICRADNIDLVIPTIDTDLLILSQHVDEFRNVDTRVLISRPDKIAICRDKNYTADFFRSCGVHAPNTVNNWKEYDGEYPCFIKPKDGSSSINAFKVDTPSELSVYAGQIGDYIVQPFIKGVEFTVDIFCDFDGKPIYITPRVRVSVRSGEVLKTRICMDEKIIQECRKIIDQFCPCGPMTVQLIRQEKTNEDYFIEINPRYGGGAPLSMKAGARSAETILKLLCGDKVDYSEETIDGAMYSRFDQSVCITRTLGGPVKGIIFDLDDTLYSEKNYVKSGFQAVATSLGMPNLEELLWQSFTEDKPALDNVLGRLGLSQHIPECLNIYRNHIPVLCLYEGVEELLKELHRKNIKVGIITDGRPAGQKNKIVALGLDKLVDDIIITDELGGVQFRKPNDIAFRIMQGRWRIPFEEMMYVGDNRLKDFQAPIQLGMKPVWFRNTEGLYQYEHDDEIKIRMISNILGVKTEL